MPPAGGIGKDGPRSSHRGGASLERYAGYGMAWVLVALLGGWIGLELDGRIGTTPLLAILGALAGAAAGLYTLYIRLFVEPSTGNGNDDE